MNNENQHIGEVTDVQHPEIVRIRTGEAKSGAPTKKRKRRIASFVSSFFTGEILVNNEIMRLLYLLFGSLALILLITTAIRFGSFNADMYCSALRAEVKLYKERAIRTSEQRTKCSSRSAILEEMKRRGIELNDPHTTPIILK